MAWKDHTQTWGYTGIYSRTWDSFNIQSEFVLEPFACEVSDSFAAQYLLHEYPVMTIASDLIYSTNINAIEITTAFAVQSILDERVTPWGRTPYEPKGSWTSRGKPD